MINVTFEPNKYKLTIRGHAGADAEGKDVVCAAASTLFYTLAQALLDSTELLKKYPVIKDEKGNGLISCKPKEAFEGTIARTYWTILDGFDMVQRRYPDYVKLVVK